MIKVVIMQSDDEILNIKISGHANSGEYGHDLVCAGVSSVVFGTLNSLEEVERAFKIKLNEEKGLTEITPLYRPSHKNKIVLEVLITSLKTIAESYGDYIKIREERK
ncbi:MAG: ribosomal-processing cysteine protease Prp [Bacilli bacterium]